VCLVFVTHTSKIKTTHQNQSHHNNHPTHTPIETNTLIMINNDDDAIQLEGMRMGMGVISCV